MSRHRVMEGGAFEGEYSVYGDSVNADMCGPTGEAAVTKVVVFAGGVRLLGLTIGGALLGSLMGRAGTGAALGAAYSVFAAGRDYSIMQSARRKGCQALQGAK